MPTPDAPLERLGFLTIGLFDEADRAAGHRTTLEMIELGERLGFSSAWVRHRHLQYGISSPVAVLAAATQRTQRIELGTAVIPLGWENPLRLAEDLATVDVLSGGRLNPGLSVGPPMNWEHVREALYPDTADAEDFSKARVARFLAMVRGEREPDVTAAFSAPGGDTRDEAAECRLAGLKAWGSPACFDVERITADSHAAYDRCWDPEGQTRQAKAISASPSREAALGALRMPVLVVHGDADRLVPPSNGRATAAAIPGSRLEIVEGMGHDYPPQYWDQLVTMITAHAQAGR